MSLSKQDIETITGIMHGVAKDLMGGGKKKAKDLSKLTKKRLYAYPLLKKNVERYKADIEDIKREDFGRSKSIVAFVSRAVNHDKPDLEEIRAAKIRETEKKIARDEEEIREIDAALDAIRDDEYFAIIGMMFFDKKSQEEIADTLHCGYATVWRQAGRLLNAMNTVLYGAAANEILA